MDVSRNLRVLLSGGRCRRLALSQSTSAAAECLHALLVSDFSATSFSASRNCWEAGGAKIYQLIEIFM